MVRSRRQGLGPFVLVVLLLLGGVVPQVLAADEAPAASLFVVDAPAPAGLDRDWAAEECRRHLSELIAINTTNGSDPRPDPDRPDGNELATARYFAAELEGLDGVEVHVLESGEGRANLVARLRAGGGGSAGGDAAGLEPSTANGAGGEDRFTAPRPVLIMGHMDVVGADPDVWTHPPFEATESGGYLYGRGAIDCKGPLAAELTAFRALVARRQSLRRDVILLATAAEEGGPSVGVSWVLEHHRDLLGDAEFALNEGGRVRLGARGVSSVNVQTTEKVSYNVTFTASGPGGHGSVPLPDNSLAALARAVARVHEWRAPVRLNATTELYFERLATIEEDSALAGAMGALVGLPPEDRGFSLAAAALSEHPPYNAVLRAGQSLTILDGGFRTNVIPSSGQAVFNLRALPDDDVAALVAEMERVAAEPTVTATLSRDPVAPPPVSPVTTDLFRAMETATAAMAPDALVIPFMSTGATDGAALRAVGIPTYGILPIPLTLEDELRMHGDDERAPVAGLGWAAEFIYRTLVAVCE